MINKYLCIYLLLFFFYIKNSKINFKKKYYIISKKFINQVRLLYLCHMVEIIDNSFNVIHCH